MSVLPVLMLPLRVAEPERPEISFPGTVTLTTMAWAGEPKQSRQSEDGTESLNRKRHQVTLKLGSSWLLRIIVTQCKLVAWVLGVSHMVCDSMEGLKKCCPHVLLLYNLFKSDFHTEHPRVSRAAVYFEG